MDWTVDLVWGIAPVKSHKAFFPALLEPASLPQKTLVKEYDYMGPVTFVISPVFIF